jgi:hypothetical protein
VRAGVAYFGLVFAAGFLLGTVRVTLLVPRLGERWAELSEMPIMALAIYLAATRVVRRYALPPAGSSRLVAGAVALLLLVIAELALAVVLQGRALTEYLASRDPVSGTVYLAMLVVFGAAPWLLSFRRRGSADAGSDS